MYDTKKRPFCFFEMMIFLLPFSSKLKSRAGEQVPRFGRLKNGAANLTNQMECFSKMFVYFTYPSGEELFGEEGTRLKGDWMSDFFFFCRLR